MAWCMHACVSRMCIARRRKSRQAEIDAVVRTTFKTLGLAWDSVGEGVVANESTSEWPICHAIDAHSTRYPGRSPHMHPARYARSRCM